MPTMHIFSPMTPGAEHYADRTLTRTPTPKKKRIPGACTTEEGSSLMLFGSRGRRRHGAVFEQLLQTGRTPRPSARCGRGARAANVNGSLHAGAAVGAGGHGNRIRTLWRACRGLRRPEIQRLVRVDRVRFVPSCRQRPAGRQV